jgi:hypothetical protein
VRLPLPEGESIVLDTSTVISYLKGDELASPVARALLEEFVASERNPASRISRA